MPVLTTELVLGLSIMIILLFAVGAYLCNQTLEQAKAPKFSVSVIELKIIKRATGIFFEVKLQSTSNAKVCINYITLKDLATGTVVVFGDSGSVDGLEEVIDLPVCIDRGVTFTLSGYHNIDIGFAPGSEVMVRFHYSFNNPNPTYDSNDPHSFIEYTKVLATS